ncbi:DNA-binding transcriptional regulator, GntR family [Nonomuraea solani]|uniref:DNA-binding transcriptional regulator, GntR family n=1 Tax=Nonomuraea solani TaxID=1144553 RepID=A0A1H5VGU5_9ACTN|nr:GntR family transcriptional regulator [Nonomuraea solani]SEF86028.1 DNA-binding transcriptional regulator, GntR family [Nonomuraea solani]
MTTVVLKPGPPARTAHAFVYETLRRAILGGDLPLGYRLVQADIAAQLKVSITPVREALRDLAGAGLVRIDAHKGAIIRELDLSEVREIYELRRMLEPVSIRKAVERITDEELDRAARLRELMAAERDPGQWVELNRQFHAVFSDAARSPRLCAILTGLRDGAAVYVGLSLRGQERARREEADRDHRELLAAFRERRAEAAVEIAIRHLNSTMTAIEQLTRT